MSKKLQPKVSIQLYRNGEKALSELSEMYRDYIKEIGQYSAKKLDPELRDVKTVKKYIIREAGATAGFVFVSRYPESVVPESIYIGEFYVKPEYRRKGIGTAAVSLAVIAAQVETVCMFTNVHNRAAASFWNHAMRGYRDGLEYGGVVACSGEDQALRFRIYSKAWLPEEKRSEN